MLQKQGLQYAGGVLEPIAPLSLPCGALLIIIIIISIITIYIYIYTPLRRADSAPRAGCAARVRAGHSAPA